LKGLKKRCIIRKEIIANITAEIQKKLFSPKR